MQNIIPDERYSVADEAILGAFFKLVKEKKPDRITVSDITKTAGIARSTFYNHYQDIPSLISAVEDKTIHDVDVYKRQVPYLLRYQPQYMDNDFAVSEPGSAQDHLQSNSSLVPEIAPLPSNHNRLLLQSHRKDAFPDKPVLSFLPESDIVDQRLHVQSLLSALQV